MEEKRKKDDPPSTRFTWTIENFSKLNTKKLYSESFYVGGYKWRVLIFPKGNNVDHFSMYLDVADSATLPYGWSIDANFSLCVINGIHNSFTVKKETRHQFNAQESDWGFTSFMPLSELYGPSWFYLAFDRCVIEADVTVFHSADDYLAHDLIKETGHIEAAKTTSGKGETPKSSCQGEIIGRINRPTASGTHAILPRTDTSGRSLVSKSATEVIKTSVPPTTQAQESVGSCTLEDELPRSPPMSSPPDSFSFDDMDAYISKLVSVVETDAPFDSSIEGSVAASIPQSTIEEAKKFFIKMLSRDLSEIPDFAAHLTESIFVLSECCDLSPAQLAELNTLNVAFPTLLKTYQTSNLSLKEVEGKMEEKQGTKKSLVEQVKINAFAFQTQRAIHKDLISKEAKLQQEVERLQAELAKISEKKKSAEKEIKELHGKTVNLEQSRSSVLEEISTLETEKKTTESSLSLVQQKWSDVRHLFMEPNN
ncbi:uncharacterized protein LOC132311736 isoform X2 [Cornus florida]|uniref:uncharacterized protein LOC132311736 isoform X2 n=1 Tax=Cornus florida TaxID=4283 RepID=UPI0028A07696|nr:uncharacterized protein LOC132311736 isoform X2 [Cornus florida]